MRDLNLPDLKMDRPQIRKPFSLEEFANFFLFHQKYMFNEKNYRWWKKQKTVDVKFVLK